jgi:hypothetical protein
MIPAPLNIIPHHTKPPDTLLPRSHFSIDTISTELVSPTESHFSSATSIYDSNDDDDAVTDDSFTFHSASTEAPSPPSGLVANGFTYSLPVGDYSSESTLKKGDVAAAGLGISNRAALRQTFGPQTFEPPENLDLKLKAGNVDVDADAVSELDQLLAEMGFLGDMISDVGGGDKG